MNEQIRGEIIQIRRGPGEQTLIIVSCDRAQVEQLKNNALYRPAIITINAPNTQPTQTQH